MREPTRLARIRKAIVGGLAAAVSSFAVSVRNGKVDGWAIGAALLALVGAGWAVWKARNAP